MIIMLNSVTFIKDYNVKFVNLLMIILLNLVTFWMIMLYSVAFIRDYNVKFDNLY